MSHPQTKDWSEISVPADQCVGTIRRAVLKLDHTLAEETDKLVEIGEALIKHVFILIFFMWCVNVLKKFSLSDVFLIYLCCKQS